MKMIAFVAGASFLCVGTLVGVRLLLLALRTRAIPELLLGAGLTSLTFVTLPLVGLSLGAHLGSRGFQTTAFAVGLLPVIGFAMCLFAFTARVFRPDNAWAAGAVWLVGIVAACGVAGTVSTRIGAWNVDAVVGARWSVLLIAPFVVGMSWTGIESLSHHLRLRKRLRLGLADPVVCDRFLLWAIGNLGAVAGTAVVAVSLMLGWRLVQHPVPILGVAVAGLTLSLSWYLAFLPPTSYLERIRSRAATA